MTTIEDVERAVRVSGPVTVTLRWTCLGWLKGSDHWAGRKRCRREFTLAHARDAYDAGMCTARCPSCGHQLTQRKDGPEVVP